MESKAKIASIIFPKEEINITSNEHPNAVKELCYLFDYDDNQKDATTKKKKTQNLKASVIRPIFKCTKCDYLTMNQPFLRMHKCIDDSKNKETLAMQGNKYISNNMHNTNEHKYNTNNDMYNTNDNIYNTNDNMYYTDDNMLNTYDNTHIAYGYNNTNYNNDHPISFEQALEDTNEDITVMKKSINKLLTTGNTVAYKCTVCRVQCENVHSFNEHMATHTVSKSLKCSECDFHGKNMVDLKRHYDEAFNEKCHCGFDIHQKYQKICHENVHSVTMIVLPDFL